MIHTRTTITFEYYNETLVFLSNSIKNAVKDALE